jgi:hypothetical protein
MPEIDPKPLLPPDYYRRNFVAVIDFVERYYRDLLNGDELSLIARFRACSIAAQCLYVRMLMRKGKLFRQDQLNYAEIEDTGIAADELERCKLLAIDDLSTRGEETPRAWLDLLRKHELAQLTDKPLRLSREQLLADASALAGADIAKYFSGLSRVFQLLGNEEVDVITLLFFANTRQTLAEFVIRDLGIMRYETYEIDQQSRFFRSRSEIDDYRLCAKLRDAWEEGSIDEPLHVLAELPHATTHPHLKRRVDRLAVHLLREIERRVEPALALQHYQQWPVRDTFERIARLHEKCGDAHAAYTVCEQMIASQLLDRETEFIKKFSRKLAKSIDRIALLGDFDYRPPTRLVALPFDEALPVEIICQQHLTQEADCFYVENGLFNALFGLTFWPAIFANVPAAFVNSFQLAPKDIYDREFRSRRSALIDDLLAIGADDARSATHMLDVYRSKFGIGNNFVNWQLIDEELLQLALQRIPAVHRVAIFERMLQDLGNRCSGFPDLIVFDETGYRLVEVKGPRDTLQDNQLSWMRHFAQHGIAHEVLHVRWQE